METEMLREIELTDKQDAALTEFRVGLFNFVCEAGPKVEPDILVALLLEICVKMTVGTTRNEKIERFQKFLETVLTEDNKPASGLH
jgi:hypothetical protein